MFNTALLFLGCGTAIALTETEISMKKLGFLLLLTGDHKGTSLVESFNAIFWTIGTTSLYNKSYSISV